jgi:putative toxin-antitoxin system antitoxin component (TIGR02293 family)
MNVATSQGGNMELSNVKQVLGLKEKIRTHLDLVKLGGKGMSKGTVVRLAKHLSIGLKGIAPLLSLNQRTIQRLSSGKVFSRTVSERILRIALVVARGEEVFGDRGRFNIWLKEPNKAMVDQTPLSLLASDFGIDMVLEELGRIEHGIIS